MGKPILRFSPKQDRIIVALFNLVSTEKLSILMRIDKKHIINRYSYLQEVKENGTRISNTIS